MRHVFDIHSSSGHNGGKDGERAASRQEKRFWCDENISVRGTDKVQQGFRDDFVRSDTWVTLSPWHIGNTRAHGLLGQTFHTEKAGLNRNGLQGSEVELHGTMWDFVERTSTFAEAQAVSSAFLRITIRCLTMGTSPEHTKCLLLLREEEKSEPTHSSCEALFVTRLSIDKLPSILLDTRWTARKFGELVLLVLIPRV
jgi:hypothetical protein